LGLLPPAAKVSGRILFHENNKPPVDLLSLPGAELRRTRGNNISMIFQEPMTALNPVFTVGSQVMETLQLHKKISRAEARQRTIALFNQVRLPDPESTLKKYPHQLSGGQKQRVMIAMAMSCAPSVLIADEPTTALDVTVQKTILELIRELQVKNNMGVLLITHDLGVVADIADTIVVMLKGEIVEQGPAKTILTNPQHPYTKALLACRPAGHPKNKRLPVVSDFMNAGPTVAVNKSSDLIEPILPGETVLQVENLSVHFPLKKNILGKAVSYFKAVDDVSFEVRQGEILGLVGESGCGKTTLGRTILQLIPATSGRIILRGQDITTIPASRLRHMRKDLQVVFQDPYGSLNPRLSIGDSITEPLQVHGLLANKKARKEKAISLLEKVNLNGDHYNRYPHEFSGGQRQRICIARALITDPSFLIFDESVSALDVSVQAQVLNLLNDFRKEFNFSAVFISHDLSVVHYTCDRIMVMQKGKIVETGSAEQVYNEPVNEYTKKLIAAIPGKQL
jgi:peptide/nickel transport system ATP-binding protein